MSLIGKMHEFGQYQYVFDIVTSMLKKTNGYLYVEKTEIDWT